MTFGGRVLPRPTEGWVTVILVYVLALVLGWTVDEPGWVNSRGSLTDALPLVAVLGATIGLVGPKVGWGRWTTHGVGALFAGLLLPILAGMLHVPGSSIPQAFHFAAEGSVQAYLDLAWRGLPLTSQEVHYTLVLSWLVWGTMQFASYAVFGHRRPLAGVVMIGIVMIANMALVARSQLGYLLLFTAGSLFLLIQMHAFDERSTWIRRRIGDPSQISALYLRGGTVFIVIAIAGSLVLTTRAASSPLAGAWGGVVDNLYEVGEELARFLPAADFRGGGGVTFGPTARIVDQWFSSDEIAFIATVPDQTEGQRWRAATYDSFTLSAWAQTAVTKVPIEGQAPLLAGRPEDPDPDLTIQVQLSVRPLAFRDSLVLSPGTPVAVDRSSNVLLTGTDGWFAGVELPGNRDPYSVTAAIPRPVDDELITQNLLKAANESYPSDVTARYTTVPDGAMGDEARRLMERIRAVAASEDPFDLAVAAEAYLRDDNNFEYDTDLSDDPCDDPSAVECFARTTHGYCLHYASTMAILLREMNPENRIPTRMVQGFLPGAERVGQQETVRNRDAHAWVEVYFPGFGWIPFDPTGGNVGIPSQLPVGQPVPSQPPASATPRPSINPLPPELGPDDLQGGGVFPPINPRDDNRPLFIAIAILLAITIIGIALLVWLRGPRGEVSPESAWRGISRTASRFGFAPRPTQTIYEYASSLGELIPAADADLQTVATARVETVYARVRLPGGQIEAVRAAARRLRLSMLRLVLRRPRRRRRI